MQCKKCGHVNGEPLVPVPAQSCGCGHLQNNHDVGAGRCILCSCYYFRYVIRGKDGKTDWERYAK